MTGQGPHPIYRGMRTDRPLKDVNPAEPPRPLDQAAAEEVALLARRQFRAGGLLMKIVNAAGSQVEDGMRLLPGPVRTQVEGAIRAGLTRSYEAAAKSRDLPFGDRIGTDRAHRVLASLSGALGGVGGLATALAELPVATTVIFRAVQGVAATYGEDPTSAETRVECLRVFGAGGPGGDPEEGLDTAFIGARLSITGPALNKLIARIAPKVAAVLSQKLAAQAVPIIGAAAGAGTNYAFINYYVELAHVHFGLRKLARDHGEAAVTEAFHSALAALSPPPVRTA